MPYFKRITCNLGTLGATLLILWLGANGSQLQAQKLSVETLHKERVPYLLPLQGQLQPKRSIAHYPAVEGEVQNIYVRSGQEVRKGERLFSVQPSTLQGKTFRINTVYARIAGTVSQIQIQPQQKVSTGNQALSIVDQSEFLLNSYISDADFPKITKDTPLNIHLDGERSNLAKENLLSGRLWQRDSIPNEQGLFPISITFPPNKALYVGKFVIASAQLSFEKGLYVLIDSIVRRSGKEYVWLLDKQNQVSLQRVELGIRRKDSLLVKDGMQDGDRYIANTNGVILKEGQKLEPNDIENTDSTDSSTTK